MYGSENGIPYICVTNVSYSETLKTNIWGTFDLATVVLRVILESFGTLA